MTPEPLDPSSSEAPQDVAPEVLPQSLDPLGQPLDLPSPAPSPESSAEPPSLQSVSLGMDVSVLASDPPHSSPVDSDVDSEGTLGENLEGDITSLRRERDRLRAEVNQTQTQLHTLVQSSLTELEQKRSDLQTKVEKLEKRRDIAREEMRTTFAGTSQELALRLQSFKEYLVGSLQDLTSTAETLDLVPPAPIRMREDPLPAAPKSGDRPPRGAQDSAPKFSEGPFQAEQTQAIRRLLELYRTEPDYYAAPWQLRRTFEPIHAERVKNWFFTQGGRGALRTLGSRLQNVLVGSAIISVLADLYGDRLRVMVLAQSPERLGDWRRGLQDCLGLRRDDFSVDRGVGLFEDPEPLALRAERMIKERLLPLIILDESEEYVSLSLLQFPLWLAFAPNPQAPSNDDPYRDNRSEGARASNPPYREPYRSQSRSEGDRNDSRRENRGGNYGGENRGNYGGENRGGNYGGDRYRY
jgi:hypothetical protein